jgi:hypothetical protein
VPSFAETFINQILAIHDGPMMQEDCKLSFLKCVSQILRDNAIANTFINDKTFVLMLYDNLLTPALTDVSLLIVEKFSHFSKTRT